MVAHPCEYILRPPSILYILKGWVLQYVDYSSTKQLLINGFGSQCVWLMDFRKLTYQEMNGEVLNVWILKEGQQRVSIRGNP